MTPTLKSRIAYTIDALGWRRIGLLLALGFCVGILV